MSDQDKTPSLKAHPDPDKPPYIRCPNCMAELLREGDDGVCSRCAPLYIEPAWLVEARGWLVRFRAAVEAAGLRWVAPVWDQDNAGDRPDFTFCAPSANGDEPHWTMWAQIDRNPGVLVAIGNEDERDECELADIPACVVLYRRWLAERSKP